MKKNPVFILSVFFIMMAMVITPVALAYSTNDPSGGGISFDLNSLLLPFQNFFQSVTSIGTRYGGTVPLWPNGVSQPAVPMPMPAGPSLAVPVQGVVQGAFEQFDSWLYGIAGFHILGLLTAVLNIFSWLLGLVKGGVDWLLKIL